MVGANGNGNANGNDWLMAECVADDELTTPEELVNMEYENLKPWDELSLAKEVENQYGIPAKHFMGKKEMVNALAMERVMKERGFIMDSDYEDAEEDSIDGSHLKMGNEVVWRT